MKRLFSHAALLLTASWLLAGCSAVYFAEYEKFGLSVEGKPDAAEPVSGSFAIKQHVVLITPGEKPLSSQDKANPPKVGVVKPENNNAAVLAAVSEAQAAKQRAAGESVSVIAYYDFQKEPATSGWFKDPVTVRSAFITGDAARALNSEQTVDAAKAITEIASIPLVQADFQQKLLPFNSEWRKANGKDGGVKDDRIIGAFNDVAKTLPANPQYTGYQNFLTQVNRVSPKKQDDYIARLRKGLREHNPPVTVDE